MTSRPCLYRQQKAMYGYPFQRPKETLWAFVNPAHASIIAHYQFMRDVHFEFESGMDPALEIPVYECQEATQLAEAQA